MSGSEVVELAAGRRNTFIPRTARALGQLTEKGIVMSCSEAVDDTLGTHAPLGAWGHIVQFAVSNRLLRQGGLRP